jgi:hypothetical protein
MVKHGGRITILLLKRQLSEENKFVVACHDDLGQNACFPLDPCLNPHQLDHRLFYKSACTSAFTREKQYCEVYTHLSVPLGLKFTTLGHSTPFERLQVGKPRSRVTTTDISAATSQSHRANNTTG